ncbi:MAG: GNAT family N-acetyltransferase [Parasphingorhabdus sp.]
MNKFKFEIRPFREIDLSQMHDVRDAAFAPIYQSFRTILGGAELARIIYGNGEDEQGAYLDRICLPDSGHYVLVATNEEKIIGFCGGSLDTKSRIGTLGLNAVHPNFTDRGVGTGLYENMLGWMKEQGMFAVQVSTGGDPSHAPARRAYEKVGFKKSIPSLLYCQTL